jgi:hypothetical protein
MAVDDADTTYSRARLQRPAKEAVRRKKNSFTIILSFPLLPKK